MAQKTSASFSRAKYFGFLLKKNIPLMLAYAIYLLFLLLISLASILRTPSYNGTIFSAYGSLLGIPVNIVIALMAAVMNFKFFTSRSECDLYFSVPVTRTTIFFSNYFAGLLMLLIPRLLLSSTPIAIWTSFNQLSTGTITQQVYFQSLTYSLLQVLFSFLTLILLYTLAVFFAVNIGKIFDICFYYLILIFVVPSGCLFFTQALNSNLLGISSNGYGSASSLFYLLTMPYLSLTFSSDRTSQWVIWLTWIAVYLAVILIVAAISYLLFRIRKTEKTQTPFAFEYFKILLSVIISLSVGLIVAMTLSGGKIDISALAVSAPAFLVASGITYLGCLAIARRSFLVFDKKLFYLCIPLAVYFVLFCYSTTGGFGRVSYVPSPDEIARVSITKYQTESDYNNTAEDPFYSVKNINFSRSRYNEVAYEIDPSYNSGTLTLENPQSIQTVVNFHKSILEHYKQFDYDTSALDRYCSSCNNNTSSMPPSSSFNYTFSNNNGYYPAANSDSQSSGASSMTIPIYSEACSSQIISDYTDSDFKKLAYGNAYSIYSPTITYTLKSGRQVTRNYSKYLSEWAEDDQFQKLQELPEEESGNSALFKKYLQHYIKSDTNLNYRSPLPFAKESGCAANITLNANDMITLLQAIYQDETVMSAAADFDEQEYLIIDFTSANYDLYRFLNKNRIIIKKNYTDTIAALKKLGFTDFSQKYKLPSGVRMELIQIGHYPYPYNMDRFFNAFYFKASEVGTEDFSYAATYFDTVNSGRIQKVLDDIHLIHSYNVRYYIVRFILNGQYYSDIYLYPFEIYQ